MPLVTMYPETSVHPQGTSPPSTAVVMKRFAIAAVTPRTTSVMYTEICAIVPALAAPLTS